MGLRASAVAGARVGWTDRVLSDRGAMAFRGGSEPLTAIQDIDTAGRAVCGPSDGVALQGTNCWTDADAAASFAEPSIVSLLLAAA